MSKNQARPICQACNRPFNPKSEGATLTMGPTCAKNAGLKLGEDAAWQLSFDDGLGAQEKPRSKSNFRFSAMNSIPPALYERYVLAKLAYDELFREFCNNGTLLQGASALELESELPDAEVHSFADPLLRWLEPEHELKLLIDRESGSAYHHRTINGVVTMLEIDPEQSLAAKQNVHAITSFSAAIAKHRDAEAEMQLPLFGLIDLAEI